MTCTRVGVALLLFCMPVSAQADVPCLLSFQGVLTDESGSPRPNGLHVITFSLYDAAIGGTPNWQETLEVSTVDGVFAVVLGKIVPLTTPPFHQPLWLGVTPQGSPELTPRTELTTAPYAFIAKSLAGSEIVRWRYVMRGAPLGPGGPGFVGFIGGPGGGGGIGGIGGIGGSGSIGPPPGFISFPPDNLPPGFISLPGSTGIPGSTGSPGSSTPPGFITLAPGFVGSAPGSEDAESVISADQLIGLYFDLFAVFGEGIFDNLDDDLKSRLEAAAAKLYDMGWEASGQPVRASVVADMVEEMNAILTSAGADQASQAFRDKLIERFGKEFCETFDSAALAGKTQEERDKLGEGMANGLNLMPTFPKPTSIKLSKGWLASLRKTFELPSFTLGTFPDPTSGTPPTDEEEEEAVKAVELIQTQVIVSGKSEVLDATPTETKQSIGQSFANLFDLSPVAQVVESIFTKASSVLKSSVAGISTLVTDGVSNAASAVLDFFSSGFNALFSDTTISNMSQENRDELAESAENMLDLTNAARVGADGKLPASVLPATTSTTALVNDDDDLALDCSTVNSSYGSECALTGVLSGASSVSTAQLNVTGNTFLTGGLFGSTMNMTTVSSDDVNVDGTLTFGDGSTLTTAPTAGDATVVETPNGEIAIQCSDHASYQADCTVNGPLRPQDVITSWMDVTNGTTTDFLTVNSSANFSGTFSASSVDATFNSVTAASVFQTSDERLKTDVRDSQYGLDDVLRLRPVMYRWRDEPEVGSKVGLIAQEVGDVIDEVVQADTTSEGYLSVAYAELVPVLIQAIQDQQEIIERQQRNIDEVRVAHEQTREDLRVTQTQMHEMMSLVRSLAPTAAGEVQQVDWVAPATHRADGDAGS